MIAVPETGVSAKIDVRDRSVITYQSRHSGASIDRVCGSRTLQEMQRRAQCCHKIRQKQSSGGRLPLSPAPAPRHAGNTRATCRGIVDKATASPVVYRRMTGKYMLDMCSVDLGKASNPVLAQFALYVHDPVVQLESVALCRGRNLRHLHVLKVLQEHMLCDHRDVHNRSTMCTATCTVALRIPVSEA